MEQDSLKELESKLEAILFVAGEPLRLEKLSKIINQSLADIKVALSNMSQSFEENRRGLRLVLADDSVQLVSAPELSSLIEDLFKSELKEELTPASLETLAIVAYKGPIKRSDIDFIRGVNSSYTLRNLLLRGLIEREGAEADGRAYEYRISFEFLRRLGLSSREALPDYEKITQAVSLESEALKDNENKLE
jgi:segregation and condensation protein B